ncbi:MAG: nuclease A inhibitor family protein [Pyrinomonadaceae bacterium]
MENYRLHDELISRLEKLCGRLNFVSETDSPVEPFTISSAEGDADAEFERMIVSQNKGPIEEIDPSIFFDRLTKEKEWHTGREKKAAADYAKLENLLRENLKGLRVLRVGSVRVDIYVAGHSSPNTITGVRTRAVET